MRKGMMTLATFVAISMGLTMAPQDAIAAQPRPATEGDALGLAAVIKTVDGKHVTLAGKYATLQTEFNKLKAVVDKCHANGCKDREQARRTKFYVRRVVKSWKLDKADMDQILGAIDQLWLKIEARFDRIDEATKVLKLGQISIMDNQRKILEKLRDGYGQCGCKCLPRYYKDMPEAAQAGAILAGKKLCPDTTAIALAVVDEGKHDLIITERGTTILMTKDDASRGNVGWGLAKTFGLTAGGCLAGYGIGYATQGNQVDAVNRTFTESNGGIGLAIGCGAGLVGGLLWAALSGDFD